MGHFLSDLAKSKEATDLLIQRYRGRGYTVRELPKAEQKNGDLEVSCGQGKFITNVEVKFDMMAQRTGNLCFEMSNGSRPTGIMETEADQICYVVPGKMNYSVYVFNPEKLRAFIQDPLNVTIKSGGDKRKFVLALATIQDIIGAELPDEVFELAKDA